MFKYKFPQSEMSGVLSHIEAFGIQIISMVPANLDFIMATDIAIDEIQLIHLRDSYNFLEIV